MACVYGQRCKTVGYDNRSSIHSILEAEAYCMTHDVPLGPDGRCPKENEMKHIEIEMTAIRRLLVVQVSLLALDLSHKCAGEPAFDAIKPLLEEISDINAAADRDIGEGG